MADPLPRHTQAQGESTEVTVHSPLHSLQPHTRSLMARFLLLSLAKPCLYLLLIDNSENSRTQPILAVRLRRVVSERSWRSTLLSLKEESFPQTPYNTTIDKVVQTLDTTRRCNTKHQCSPRHWFCHSKSKAPPVTAIVRMCGLDGGRASATAEVTNKQRRGSPPHPDARHGGGPARRTVKRKAITSRHLQHSSLSEKSTINVPCWSKILSD